MQPPAILAQEYVATRTTTLDCAINACVGVRHRRDAEKPRDDHGGHRDYHRPHNRLTLVQADVPIELNRRTPQGRVLAVLDDSDVVPPGPDRGQWITSPHRGPAQQRSVRRVLRHEWGPERRISLRVFCRFCGGIICQISSRVTTDSRWRAAKVNWPRAPWDRSTTQSCYEHQRLRRTGDPRRPLRLRSHIGCRKCGQNVGTAGATARTFDPKMRFTSTDAEERLEPPVRIELTTARLQGECSTTELRRPGKSGASLIGHSSLSMMR